MRVSTAFASSLAAALIIGVAGTAAAQVKPEKLIEYRQDAMGVIGFNFSQMGAQVKGDIPYNKDVFSQRAATVEFVSKLPMEGFVPGTEKGHETKAKVEVWAKMDDFKAKMEKMQTEVSKLAAVAKTGNQDDIKKQFGATAGACKACHDDYRAK
ncbi:MAG: cytochrome c [Betaproteobacteria bacterium]|nr:cytochrome c [Betaproteobacteria bacterium]